MNLFFDNAQLIDVGQTFISDDEACSVQRGKSLKDQGKSRT